MPGSAATARTQLPLPRGIRNNNPGNIRHSPAAWLGKAAEQKDTSFVCFKTPEYGIRAMARILINYQKRYNLKTIEKMISRWAPPNENNTAAYVAAVSRSVGLTKNSDINLITERQKFNRLLKAIINHENGSPKPSGKLEWYSDSVISKGIMMAINPEPTKMEDRSLKHANAVEHFRNT